MMRAIVQRAYGAADVLRLQDIAAPDPGPHDVLVGVHAASVNHGDWFATCGRPYVMRAAFGMRRPRVAVRGHRAHRGRSGHARDRSDLRAGRRR
jgi:NADPH:quinone reductase-like Zn-dependent oxidoreductase